MAFNPARIRFYGYWGPPSASAVTPYERLCFVACALSKRGTQNDAAVQVVLDLPAQIRSQMERVFERQGM